MGKNQQAVVQIRPERAFAHRLLQVAVGGRDHAHVHALGLRWNPIRSNSPSCKTRNSLAWQLRIQLPDLVQNKVPPSATSKRPDLVRQRSRECAPDVAEQLALDQAGGQARAQLTLTRAARRARAALVDRAGQQFLARPRLALQQRATVVHPHPPRG